VRQLVEFPRLRTTPDYVVRGLREVDPTAELVYIGRGKWLLGSVRWDRRHVSAARKRLDAAFGAVKRIGQWKASHPRVGQRVAYWTLALQGFRPIAEYKLQGEPDSRIVNDFRRMDWMYKNTSDNQLERLLDEPYETGRREARADLTDEARARDAWRNTFTLSHTVTRFDDPAKRSGSGRSGFKVERRLA
jgi:hypothetical protein